MHMYEDDIQIYPSFSYLNLQSALKNFNDDLNRLADVALEHSLTLNPIMSVASVLS